LPARAACENFGIPLGEILDQPAENPHEFLIYIKFEGIDKRVN
jgi:hypothetical protein